jgi:hypothetical protein
MRNKVRDVLESSDTRPASALIGLLETLRASAYLLETRVDGPKEICAQAERA